MLRFMKMKNITPGGRGRKYHPPSYIAWVLIFSPGVYFAKTRRNIPVVIFVTIKGGGIMMEKAKQIVVDYFNSRVDKTDSVVLTKEDVYIVWFSKTLQNWKALVSTNISDGMYYEVTYNGDREETYLDAYKKWENKCIPN